MKQPIKPEDIRKGDLIRNEDRAEESTYRSVEYRADHDGHELFFGGVYYLLDRPVPPFEPYWGMVIVNPQNTEKAIYLPEDGDDEIPWAATADGLFLDDFQSAKWANQKLAEGWVVLAKLEGVK